MRRAAAAPRCHRRLGLTTVVLLGLSSLGFAASQALAGGVSEPELPTEPTATSSTTGVTVQAAPAPDPKPAPKPDPKPAQPKPRTRAATPPPPPPPPPSATKRTARSSTTAQAKGRTTRRAPLRRRAASTRQAARPNRLKAAARKKRAAAAALAARRRARLNALRKARRQHRPVRATKPAARKPAARKRSRPSVAVPADASLDHDVLPAPVLARSEPQLSLAVPVFLPLFGLGVLLLLGASAISVRRIPWPAIAQPLYARRSDVAAIGFGAIALALLLLNAAVFF